VTWAATQRRPPNYSLDDMPDTNFSCRDKILGGYYADLETDCQMFHVCVKVPGVGVSNRTRRDRRSLLLTSANNVTSFQ
jgi:hypothetical protein